MLILNRYATCVVKETAKHAILEIPEGRLTDQEVLFKMLRKKMREAARRANLSERRAVLFGRQSPVIAKLGSSVTKDLLLYKGYTSYFDTYLHEVVARMTGNGKNDIPGRLIKRLGTDIGRDLSILESWVPFPKPELGERGTSKPENLPARELFLVLQKVRAEDCQAVYLRREYAEQYGIEKTGSPTVSGSVPVKDTAAAGQIQRELSQWADQIKRDSSCRAVYGFVEWLNRFDKEIVLSSWLDEVFYLTQDIQDIEGDRVRPYHAKEGIYRMTFDRPSMLRSLDFDLFMQGKSCACLLEKKGTYYLLLLNPKRRCELDADAWGCGYRVLTYKQVRHPERSFPRLFLQEKYHPDPLLVEKVRNKSYRYDPEYRKKWIAHCVKCLLETPDYALYQMKLKDPEAYDNLRDFYRDVERQAIYMGYDHEIRPEYIQNMIERKEACLFELYCMDFSKHHHGKMSRNAQTLVTALSEDNMKNITCGAKGGIKILGGSCRIYTREKQTEPVLFPAGTSFHCKNGKVRTLPYDVTRKKRFTQRKYLFSMSVEILEENKEPESEE